MFVPAPISQGSPDSFAARRLHVHFNGAAGNSGAGEYNDGNKDNRMVLTRRLADGRKQAFAQTNKHALTRADVGWDPVLVKLPPASYLKREKLIKDLKSERDRG